MRISDGSSDVCSSDLHAIGEAEELQDVRGLAGRVGGELHRVLGHAELVVAQQLQAVAHRADRPDQIMAEARDQQLGHTKVDLRIHFPAVIRSEEHTSELQSLMRISYAVFCLKKKQKQKTI